MNPGVLLRYRVRSGTWQEINCCPNNGSTLLIPRLEKIYKRPAAFPLSQDFFHPPLLGTVHLEKSVDAAAQAPGDSRLNFTSGRVAKRVDKLRQLGIEVVTFL